MFHKILHANDGSDHAFHAFALALQMAKQDEADLHMVSVEEIPYLPESIEEVREARQALLLGNSMPLSIERAKWRMRRGSN